MQPIERYALESHVGPYARWPLASRLVVDGTPLEARVPGYVVEAQYATPHGTLLVTSYDCPFEESNDFLLLDAGHRILAKRSLLTPYASWLLDAHWPVGDSSLVLHYGTDVFLRLDLLPPRRWWSRRPALRLRRVHDWHRDARMVAARDALEGRIAQVARAHAPTDDGGS